MSNTLVEISSQLAAVVERVGPAVVTVAGRPRGTASGIHWANNIVVTANHAVKATEDIGVRLADGRTVGATLLGRDTGTDLAVLKVEGLGESPANFGEADAVRPGDLTLVLGRHAENGVMASFGVVSVVSDSRRTWAGGTLDRYMRLDVALYPGLSGGAVVDVEGRILGMATAALSRVAPLTVPASTINRVVTTLAEKGHIPRGYLGIGLQPVSIPAELKTRLSLSSSVGIIVLNVEPAGPADQAGLMIGDIMVTLDDHPVDGVDDLRTFLDSNAVGQSRKVRAIRGGELKEFRVVVGDRPGRR